MAPKYAHHIFAQTIAHSRVIFRLEEVYRKVTEPVKLHRTINGTIVNER